jgi:hypothetical protein
MEPGTKVRTLIDKRYMRRERLRKRAAERELADALHRVMTSAFCRPGEDER